MVSILVTWVSGIAAGIISGLATFGWFVFYHAPRRWLVIGYIASSIVSSGVAIIVGGTICWIFFGRAEFVHAALAGPVGLSAAMAWLWARPSKPACSSSQCDNGQ